MVQILLEGGFGAGKNTARVEGPIGSINSDGDWLLGDGCLEGRYVGVNVKAICELVVWVPNELGFAGFVPGKVRVSLLGDQSVFDSPVESLLLPTSLATFACVSAAVDKLLLRETWDFASSDHDG